jgi:hypothetical protein
LAVGWDQDRFFAQMSVSVGTGIGFGFGIEKSRRFWGFWGFYFDFVVVALMVMLPYSVW